MYKRSEFMKTSKEYRDNVMAGMRTNEIEGYVYTDEEKAIFKQVADGKMSIEQAKEHFMLEINAMKK